MTIRSTLGSLALVAGLFAGASMASAQDSGPLIDLLVRKGIVSYQEAESLRAELVRDFAANTPAGKLNLTSHVTDFKLSGDLRIRGQYETQAPEVNPTGVTNERFRNRFRFRFNGDFGMPKGWSAGFALETAAAADSGNQTLQDGGDDYATSLARAYVGYRPNANWNFVAGKQRNLIYTTDLVWDGDINPQGFYQSYTKFLSGKDTFEIRAGQWMMDDRNESTAGPSGRDAWLFTQQAVYTKWFAPDNLSSFTIAPGFMKYNASVLDGQTGEASFVGTTRYLTNFVMPGAVNFAHFGRTGASGQVYWDYSYNFEANQRVRRAYGMPAGTKKDGTAWLLGVGYAFGNGRVQGDYSLKLDYRQIGLGSIDPNINDSDFAFSHLNQKGFKLATSYNLTDFANFNLTYMHTTHLRAGVNQATIAARDHTQLLQADLVVRF